MLGETKVNSSDRGEASHTQNIAWLQMRPVVALDSSINSASSTNSKPADTQISWLHSDHLLTTRAATDANQNLIWRWHSDAFGVGEAESFTVNSGQNNQKTEETFTLNLRFPGQYHDAESGLHYNYHRTYDPSMGRYTQSDPIGLMGGVNTFGYVEGSPLIMMDLLGLCAEPTTSIRRVPGSELLLVPVWEDKENNEIRVLWRLLEGSEVTLGVPTKFILKKILKNSLPDAVVKAITEAADLQLGYGVHAEYEIWQFYEHVEGVIYDTSPGAGVGDIVSGPFPVNPSIRPIQGGYEYRVTGNRRKEAILQACSFGDCITIGIDDLKWD